MSAIPQARLRLSGIPQALHGKHENSNDSGMARVSRMPVDLSIDFSLSIDKSGSIDRLLNQYHAPGHRG